MQIKNTTKKTIVTQNADMYSKLWQKARGLMFSRQKDIVFVEKKERIVSLHMWFVFYPIDVIYCNAEKQVVECKKHFMPFTFYMPKNKAKYIIECKAGTIQESKTIPGDHLHFLLSSSQSD